MKFNSYMGKYSKGNKQEDNKNRHKRIDFIPSDMKNIMLEYNYVIESLGKSVNQLNQTVRNEIYQNYHGPDKEELCAKHKKICDFAKAGVFNFEELQEILNSGDYFFNEEDAKRLLQINHLQREKYYLFCCLASDRKFGDMRKETIRIYKSVCETIKDFKETSFKTNIGSIVRGDIGDSSSNNTETKLFDTFIEGMKYASEHNLKGIEDTTDITIINANSYESQQAFASGFVDIYITKNPLKNIPLKDIESLNKISDYMNNKAMEFSTMSDEEFLEYKINQMHPSNEEIEKFEYKVSEFVESERVYNGRSI